MCVLGSMAPDRSLVEWLVWDAKALPLDLWEHQWSRDLHLGQGQPVEPDWGRRRAPCALESRSLVPLFSHHCRPTTVFFKETREENITLPFIFFFFSSFIKHLKNKQNASGAWNCAGANVMSPMSWMNTAHVKTSNTTDPAHALSLSTLFELALPPYLLFVPTVQLFSLSPAPASPFSSTLLFYVPTVNLLFPHPSSILPLFFLPSPLYSLLFPSFPLASLVRVLGSVINPAEFSLSRVCRVMEVVRRTVSISQDHPSCGSWEISHTRILPWSKVCQQEALPAQAGISIRSPLPWSLQWKNFTAIGAPAAIGSSVLSPMEKHCLNIVELVWYLEFLPGAFLVFPDAILPHHMTGDTFLLFS